MNFTGLYDFQEIFVIREGAKFIGLHQGQPGGGARSFCEEKNDGATTFFGEKNDGDFFGGLKLPISPYVGR